MFIKEIQLKKWGNSQGIRIGKEELRELGYTDEEWQFLQNQMICRKNNHIRLAVFCGDFFGHVNIACRCILHHRFAHNIFRIHFVHFKK